MQKIIIGILLSLLSLDIHSQVNAIYINTLIGRGVNGYLIISGGEGQWNHDEYDSISSAGFNSVRIVYVRGDVDSPIDGDDLNVLQSVVDSCLLFGLLPVIDYHVTPPWFENYTKAQADIFVANWGAIANHLDGYDYDEVVFELANEPREISQAIWDTLAEDCVDTIRYYDADRIIMISPVPYASIKGLLNFQLPDDTSLILSVHYYEPGWIIDQNVPWPGDDYGIPYAGTHWRNIQPIIANLEEEFAPVFEFQAANNNIPVNIGEYGTYIFCDTTNRIAYTNLLTKWWETKGFSHMWWEYDQWFGIMKNPSLGEEEVREWYEGMTEAITSDFCILYAYDSTVIIQSDFGSVGDWSTYVSGDAAMDALSVSGGELVITVTAADDYLNARVWSPSFDLEKDSIYRVSYTMRTASGTKTLAHKYNGDHPWYYTYDLGTSSETRVETYIMPTTTQSNAYFELLVGVSTGTLYLENFTLERITPHSNPIDTIPESISVEDTLSAADTLWFKDASGGYSWDTDTACNDTAAIALLQSSGGGSSTLACYARYRLENNFNEEYNSLNGTGVGTNTFVTDSVKESTYSYDVRTSNDRFYTPDLTLGDTFTVCMWVNPVYNAATEKHIFSTHNNRSDNGLEVYIVGGSDPAYLRAYTGNGSTNDIVTTSSALVYDSLWNHIAVTFDKTGASGIVRFFVNGTKVNSTDSTTLNDFNADSIFYFGGDPDGGNDAFSYLDDIQIYPFKLTTSEINDLYNNPGDTLLRYYGSSETYKDSSWVYFDNVDFDTGYNAAEIYIRHYESIDSLSLILRLDSSNAVAFDSLIITYSGSCYIDSILFTQITGLHDLYIELSDTAERYVWIKFFEESISSGKVKMDIWHNEVKQDIWHNGIKQDIWHTGSTEVSDGEAKAFPGAAGYGADSRMAYELYNQTQDPDDLPEILTVDTISTGLFSTGTNRGTLRWCIAQTYPRIILFERGGVWDFTGTGTYRIDIEQPYCAIYGQSAPWPGFIMKSAFFQVETHDVLIQHLKMRIGLELESTSPGARDGITIAAGSDNVVIDHCSFAWASDETISSTAITNCDWTISNCIIAEGIQKGWHGDTDKPEHHSMFILWTGGVGNRGTLYRNLMYKCLGRPPRTDYDDAIIINNVVYGSPHVGDIRAEIGTRSYIDHVANLSQHMNTMYNYGSAVYAVSINTTMDAASRLYVDDNSCKYLDDNPEATQWDLVQNNTYITQSTIALHDLSDYIITNIVNLEDTIQANVGAFYWSRDYADAGIITKWQADDTTMVDSHDTIPARASVLDYTYPQNYTYSYIGDMTSGHDWSSNADTIFINSNPYIATANCANKYDVIDHLNSILPAGFECDSVNHFKPMGWLRIQTTTSGSGSSFTINGGDLAETLAIPSGTFYGQDNWGFGFTPTSHILSVPSNPHDDWGNGYTNLEMWQFNMKNYSE